jgi:hypothetical protein
MSANVEAMVREGVNAFKAGRKDEARALLLKATELDQYNEQAWLWLSGLMDSPEDQRTCLENVLAINPENERARQGLSFLTGQTSTGSISPFSAAAPSPSAPPPSMPPPSMPPSAPTSVEWAAPEEPPALPGTWTRAAPVEPSPDALDDWVTNLNLPANDPSMSSALNFSAAASAGSSASPFGDFDLNDDDNFANGPFSAPTLEFEPDASFAAPARRSPPPPPLAAQPGTRRARLPTAPEEGSLLYQIDDNAPQPLVAPDEESEMFGYIPPEIRATRLPGTRERVPVVLTLGIVVLVLLNIGLALVTAMAILT